MAKDPDKMKTMAELRAWQGAETYRLHVAGYTRTRIAAEIGISTAKVSQHLAARGIAPVHTRKPITPAERAIIAEAVTDRSISIGMLAQRLPGRDHGLIGERLRMMRVDAGQTIKRQGARPPVSVERDEDEAPCGPDWPLPPGAYRDRHGITIARIACFDEPSGHADAR